MKKSIYWLKARLVKGYMGCVGNFVPSCKEPLDIKFSTEPYIVRNSFNKLGKTILMSEFQSSPTNKGR